MLMKNKAIDLIVQKYNKSKQQVFLIFFFFFGVINSITKYMSPLWVVENIVKLAWLRLRGLLVCY